MEIELATRLNCAAHDGHLDLVKRLIGFGADPNKTDYDGRTPLVCTTNFHELNHRELWLLHYA